MCDFARLTVDKRAVLRYTPSKVVQNAAYYLFKMLAGQSIILSSEQSTLYDHIQSIFTMFNIFSNFSVVVRILSELLVVVLISQRLILVGEEL